MIVFKKGISNKSGEVASAAGTVASDGTDAISEYNNRYYNIGVNLVEGFARGIRDRV